MSTGIYPSILHCIGNTPLIKLRHASELTGCQILGKAEFLNPGASVKDRAALGIVNDALAKKQIERRGTVVEGTAGNTGIGLALVGNALGLKTLIVMPDTQSPEKVATLRAYGAEVRQIPAVPYKNPAHFVHESGRIAQQLAQHNSAGVLWANQFDNLANKQAHFDTTGPEIWCQTDGTIDGFVCSVGTGGTLAGVAQYLKSRNKQVKIALADPNGSALYNYFANGEFKSSGNSITEGIGNSRITENLADTCIDIPYQISDEESLPIAFALQRDEGLCLGGSSGVNVAGAIRLAKELGPGHTIVTILCDTGLRYLQRMYNRKFLAEKNIPIPDWLK